MSSIPANKKLATKIKDLKLKLAAYEKGVAPQLITEEFRRLANRSRDMIYQYDLTTRQFAFVNNTSLEFYGIDVEGGREVTTKSVLLSIHPEDRDKVKKAQNESLAPGSTGGEVEYRQIRPDGSLHWMHDRWIVIRDEMGNPVIIEGIVRDNTERKRTEEERREKSRLNQTLLDSFPCVALLLRPQTREVTASNTAAVKVGALPGTHCFSTWGQRKDPCPWCLAPALWATGEKQHLEVEVLGIFWDAYWIPVEENLYMHFAFDITERKRVEDALRVSEAKLSKIFHSSSNGMVFTEFDSGRIVDVNTTWAQASGIAREEAIGKTSLELGMWAERADREACVAEFKKVGRLRDYETTLVMKSKKLTHMIAAEVIEMGDKRYVLWEVRDITDRKRAEERIHASLQEKEILLREVHHRVKNNMQVISGLLDLQARSSGNPELMERLSESQRRIQAMSLVHEKLYGSKDFARIDIAGYVRALSQDLFQSYKINPGRIDLVIQIDGDVYVDINKAIPCGLILNELISNALKHAFPGDGPGKLQIIIGGTKDGEIEIIVHDNGLGLPDYVDPHQPRSVGLHVVTGLVENQLDGQMEVKRDNGTEFRITFPL